MPVWRYIRSINFNFLVNDQKIYLSIYLYWKRSNLIVGNSFRDKRLIYFIVVKRCAHLGQDRICLSNIHFPRHRNSLRFPFLRFKLEFEVIIIPLSSRRLQILSKK